MNAWPTSSIPCTNTVVTKGLNLLHTLWITDHTVWTTSDTTVLTLLKASVTFSLKPSTLSQQYLNAATKLTTAATAIAIGAATPANTPPIALKAVIAPPIAVATKPKAISKPPIATPTVPITPIRPKNFGFNFPTQSSTLLPTSNSFVK